VLSRLSVSRGGAGAGADVRAGAVYVRLWLSRLVLERSESAPMPDSTGESGEHAHQHTCPERQDDYERFRGRYGVGPQNKLHGARVLDREYDGSHSDNERENERSAHASVRLIMDFPNIGDGSVDSSGRAPRIAIRPPEYWPRAETAALALHADRLIIADTFQYSRQSYHNRTRIRTPQGWQWLSVPLKGGQHGRPISLVEIDDRTDWRGKHLRALDFNYRTSPFYSHYGPAVRELLSAPWRRLGPLTAATVGLTLRMLELHDSVSRLSEDREACEIVARVHGGTTGMTLVVDEDSATHDAAYGTALGIVAYREAPRRQNFIGFEQGLTALDLVFNYGPAAREVIERATTRQD